MAVEYPLRNNPEQIKHIESVFYNNGNKPMTAIALAEQAWDPQVFNFSKNTLRDYIRRIAVKANYSILDVKQSPKGIPVWDSSKGQRAFLYVLNPSKEDITDERIKRLKKFTVKQRRYFKGKEKPIAASGKVVLSVKLTHEEFDLLTKNYESALLENDSLSDMSQKVSRHKYVQNLLLGRNSTSKPQYPTFLNDGFVKSIVNQAQAVERFHTEKTDEEKMKIFMNLFQNLVFPKIFEKALDSDNNGA